MIEFQRIEHIIDQQDKAEQGFLAEYHEQEYTLEQPYIKVNPYLIAPLTAIIMFTTGESVEVTLRVKSRTDSVDLETRFPRDTAHVLPIYGLYAGDTNKVEITLSDGRSTVVEIETEGVIDEVKQPTAINTTAEYMGDKLMFLTPSTPAMTAAYDGQGECRWYCTRNLSFDLKRLANGNLLVGNDRLMMPPYHTTGLYEMNLLGKVYKEYRLPGGYHHDQFEMEDGNLLVLTQDFRRGTVEDLCVLVDRQSGEIIKTWDIRSLLPQNVAPSVHYDAHDWFHNNSVWYDKKSNSLTLSGRHQDIVINIDYDTGQLNWILGDPEGWPEDIVKQYFFTPVGEEFEWQYEQHAAVILPDGGVLVFDNGTGRAKNSEKRVKAAQNYSRGVQYRLNHDKKTVEQVWEYGKERGAEFFSNYISNVEFYDEGHYMIHSGGMGTVDGMAIDVPPARLINQGIDLKLNSITVEVKDGEVVYELQIPGNYYRAEKLSLYDVPTEIIFGKGKLLGSLGQTRALVDAFSATKESIHIEQHSIELVEETDRLIVKGIFEAGQLLILELEGEHTQQYLVPTTKRPFLAMCVGTFQGKDPRVVQFPLNKEGLYGEYNVNLIIDGVRTNLLDRLFIGCE